MTDDASDVTGAWASQAMRHAVSPSAHAPAHEEYALHAGSAAHVFSTSQQFASEQDAHDLPAIGTGPHAPTSATTSALASVVAGGDPPPSSP
jgi:hypothetical protein